MKKVGGEYEYILMIIDNFTKIAQAYTTYHKSGKTAAENIFLNDFHLKFAFPASQLGQMRTTYSDSCRCTQEIKTQKQVPITRRGTQQKDITQIYFQCYRPWMREI